MSTLLDFRRNDASGRDDQQRESSRIIRVDIAEIDVSHINPRKTRGEHYESTKQSIKNIGLQSTLTITRLPNSERYSLYSGGNTRLTILKELVEEYIATGEVDKANTLRWQDCRYVPYTDDLDLLIKHMAENEERSGMTFIDKARAVFQIRELYLQQTSEESVSNSKLVKFIHSLGWTRVNRQVMTELSFAYDELKDVIPFALEAGMGKPKVNQLRLWLSYVEIYIKYLIENHNYDYSIEKARQLYFKVLSEHDNDLEPINLDAFFESFRYQLSDTLRPFNSKLTSVRIAHEIDHIAEHGEVFKEIDPEELTRRLEETTDMPPADFPTPRKTRSPSSPKSDTGNQNIEATKSIKMELEQQEITTNEVPKPPSSSVDLPNKNLSYDQHNAEICSHVHKLYRTFLEKYDSTRALQNVMLFEELNENNRNLLEHPPYSQIDLSDDAKFDALKKTLESCSRVERYALLSIIILWDFYARNIITLTDHISEKRLQQLSQQWEHKYNDYQLACRTGLIYTIYETPDLMKDVWILNNQLLELFYAAKTLQ